MKILFIYPDTMTEVGYSSGIGMLSAGLRKNGHETRLIHVCAELDYPLDMLHIVQDISRFEPHLICFSVSTNQWHVAQKIGCRIRESFTTPILVGGYHATADPDAVMAERWVDFTCRGEGDRALPELVNRLKAGLTAKGICNLMHRENGRVLKEPLCGWVEDLDTLPFDDYSIFDYQKIIETRSGWAEVIVSRGCRHSCSYCYNQPLFNHYRQDLKSSKGMTFTRRDYVRRNSVPYAIDKLKRIKRKYPNVSGFTFVDDILASDDDWFSEFAGQYQNEIGLPYACASHPLAFNQKVAALLKASGCKVVKMGVESGNPEIRAKVLKRRMSNDRLCQVFGVARDFGLKPQAFNMIGIPGETLDDIAETIRLNAKIKPYIVWVATFVPHPGTAIYGECVKKEMLDSSKWGLADSYRGDSLLKEAYLPALAFRKIRVMIRWHLNACLDNGAGDIYKNSIRELESLPEQKWIDGTAEELFHRKDREIDLKLREQDISHYIQKKYINILWGGEYDYDLS
ncbi:MAG: radical SAM protein [Planctomycetota bacterium]